MTTGLEAVLFEHVALPEVSWDQVDLSTDFLGQRIGAPLMIGSMTDGPRRAGAALLGHLDIVLRQLRTACFCTGSADLAALRHVALIARQPDPGA